MYWNIFINLFDVLNEKYELKGYDNLYFVG